MKIVLLGYMASGKSTVGRLLARQLGISFVDLDDYIEQHQKKSIKDIFSEKGEIFFRKLEHQMLKEVLDSLTAVVLSTGGGTPCYANNMETILQQSDNSIYLNHSIPVLVERITKEKEHRPLVKNIPDNDLPEFVGKHLFERRSFYMQAEHRVDCDPLSAEEVVAEIKKLL
ncbi:MAG: shikimate kinase [Muricauda sp.]|nr:shikimate kinase [Allomuricauda sp.]MBO6590482.1 shikimate kinase [Allomuricauda sp.]MBO6620061.1 shikimate kinase [Allomuricauda sp.]MBO6646003.1 shikimate kinase [Allomuricauda sp.]MBO6748399.1 shikimate kinase [Allomuricauda sp.]MBO6845347.1 shikimate kinase [Allomuricauda sp.]